MDREFVEKVTRMVVSVLEDMKNDGTFTQQQALKIWPHQTPLPDPEVMAYAEAHDSHDGRTVTFSPYA